MGSAARRATEISARRSGKWGGKRPPGPLIGQRSVDQFLADRGAMVELVSDPQADLYQPFAHGTGQTLLREALVLADHHSYHVGQLVLLRRLLGVLVSPSVFAPAANVPCRA